MRFFLALLVAQLCAVLPFAAAQHWPALEGEPGDELARFVVQVPDAEVFVAWGTLPVPAGVHLPAGGSPLTVLDQHGQPRRTQAGVVRWRADGTPAVLELAATLERGDLEPGSWTTLAVTDRAQAEGGWPHAPQANQLVLTAGAVKLRAVDLHGAVYEASLTGGLGTPSWRWHRLGPARSTVRVQGWLNPTEGTPSYWPAGGGAATWTAEDGSDVLELDLQLMHTAPIGWEALWLTSLELVVPAAWEVVPSVPMPYLGPSHVDGAHRVYPLAPAQEDGTLHVMRWGDRHAWRLALHRAGEHHQAQGRLERRGWALADPAPGLWSWSNPICAGLGVLGEPAPNLEGHPGLVDQLAATWQDLAEDLMSGRTHYYAGDGAPRLGPFFHSYGVPYGGMTGIADLKPWGAVRFTAIEDGEHAPEGMLYLEHLAGMTVDRQRGLISSTDGWPLQPWPLYQAKAEQGWNRWRAPGMPTWNANAHESMRWGREFAWLKGDPFGQDAAPRTATAAAFESGRVPAYYWNAVDDKPGPLWSWAPHDGQHALRHLWPLAALVELSNDPMAREWLIGEAAVAALEYDPTPGGRLGQLLEDAQEAPECGSGHAGRAYGHTAQLWAAAYAVTPPAQRAAWRPLLQATFDALAAVETPFGVFQVTGPPGKVADLAPMNGEYLVAQSIESSYTALGLAALAGALATGADDERRAIADAALVKHALGVATWGAYPDGGTYFRAAVAPVDDPHALFLEGPPVVDGGNTSTITGPLAMGLRRAPNTDGAAEIRAALARLFGLPPSADDSDFVAEITAKGPRYLYDVAPALALFQDRASGL